MGGGALYAPFAHTCDAGGLFAAQTPQIRPLGSPMGILPIRLAFFLASLYKQGCGIIRRVGLATMDYEQSREEVVGESVEHYRDAVKTIKTAILQSQYEAAKSVNEKQLKLYFAIGQYISKNSRDGFWGKGAIDAISEQLQKELPGLRGFSARNLRNMRFFYEAWSDNEDESKLQPQKENVNLADASAKLVIQPENKKNSLSIIPEVIHSISDEFFAVSFSHHIYILSKTTSFKERIFYIQKCYTEKLSYDALKQSINHDDYHHQGNISNNFIQTISPEKQAFMAVNAFKDEYLLDFINVEELDVRDKSDVDERIVENGIVQHIKEFILTFGKDFAFIRNQYHLDAFGEDQYIDLLFFNRSLNCLVAVELKKGAFKSAYLGQLSGYLSILDGFEKKPHENPSIGIILCKDMNKAFVDYIIRDYDKPMGVATYKTSKDMSDELRKALPDIEDLKRLLESDGEDDA